MDDEFDDIDVELQDLAVDEIQELLLEAGLQIGQAEIEQLAHFVRNAGSLDEALVLLSELSTQRDAA